MKVRNEESKRFLSDYEQRVIKALTQALGPSAFGLVRELDELETRVVDPNRSIEIAPYPEEGNSEVPVEGQAPDRDGVMVHVLLHVRRGILSELEFYRDDGELIRQFPEPDSLEIFVSPK